MLDEADHVFLRTEGITAIRYFRFSTCPYGLIFLIVKTSFRTNIFMTVHICNSTTEYCVVLLGCHMKY